MIGLFLVLGIIWIGDFAFFKPSTEDDKKCQQAWDAATDFTRRSGPAEEFAWDYFFDNCRINEDGEAVAE